jgi:outer membrane protein assembly factor BamA
MHVFFKSCFLIIPWLFLVCHSGYGFFKFSKKDTLRHFSNLHTLQALNSVIDTVIFQGNKVTRNEVLSREILFKSTDTLTVNKIKQSQSELFNLLLFNKVKISARRFRPNDSIQKSKGLNDYLSTGQKHADQLNRSYTIVLVTVYERWYFVPIPIFDLRGTSFTQWIRNPGLSNLNFGLMLQDQNFTGHGDLLSASFGLGFDPFVGLSYSTPYVFGSDKYGLGVAAEYRELRNTAEGAEAFEAPEYNQINRSVAFSASQRFSAFDMIGLYGQFTSITVEQEIRDRYPFSTIAEDGAERFITLSAYYTYQRLDYILFPLSGFFFSAKLSKVGFPGGGQNLDFSRAAFDFRIYEPLSDNFSVAWRSFSVLSSNQPVPNHQRLFLGFGTKLRGYTGQIFNGDNLQLNSLELRAPIIRLNTIKLDFIPIEQLSIIQYGLFMSIFLDAATIWYNPSSPGPEDRLSRFDFSNYKFGYGAGLVFIGGFQWTSRVDFAFSDQGDFEIIFEKKVSF